MPNEFRVLTYKGKAVTDRLEGYKEIVDPEDLDPDCFDEEEDDEAYWDNYLRRDEQ